MKAAHNEDVEMAEPETTHPLQAKFDDAAELVAGFTATSQPGEAIQLYQEILAYQGTSGARCVREKGREGERISRLTDGGVCRPSGRRERRGAAREGACDLQARAALHPVRVRRPSMRTRTARREEEGECALVSSTDCRRLPACWRQAREGAGDAAAVAASVLCDRREGQDREDRCVLPAWWWWCELLPAAGERRGD